jgi:hypothetical protein
MGSAITPATIELQSAGSQFKYICKFTAITASDTWDSGIKGATNFHAQVTAGTGTQTSAGINVAYVASTGVFTFNPGLDAQTVTLFVFK